MNRAGWWGLTALTALVAGAGASESIEPAPSVDEIVRKLQAADRARQASFSGYSGIRSYEVENARFGVRATMRVEVKVDAGGGKNFRVLQSTGPAAVRKMVFQRMLDTEALASAPSHQQSTRISANNYSFRLAETAVVNGRKLFVLEAEPRNSNPLLFRGRVWVDAEELAIVRIEGSPARNPSAWVRKTRFVHEYRKTGSQWLAGINYSETEVRIFGNTVVRIDYSHYDLGS